MLYTYGSVRLLHSQNRTFWKTLYKLHTHTLRTLYRLTRQQRHSTHDSVYFIFSFPFSTIQTPRKTPTDRLLSRRRYFSHCFYRVRSCAVLLRNCFLIFFFFDNIVLGSHVLRCALLLLLLLLTDIIINVVYRFINSEIHCRFYFSIDRRSSYLSCPRGCV